MFYELRQYQIQPGRRDEWVHFMEDTIIPFQVSLGMVIAGSFVGEKDDDLYVWMRRFESEEQRKAQYEAVYQSDYWKTAITPKVDQMLIRDKIVVTRLQATPKSVIQ